MKNSLKEGDWVWKDLFAFSFLRLQWNLCYHPNNKYLQWLPWEMGITLCKHCRHKHSHHTWKLSKKTSDVVAAGCNYPDSGTAWITKPRDTKCICLGWGT